MLAVHDDRAELRFLADDLRASYRLRALWGLGTLRALGRMAFPVALGTAIVVMGRAAAQADVTSVERALSLAFESLTLGVMSAVFCRASATMLQRQAEARAREISLVCRRVAAALGPG
jgi:hypothetical protein